MSPSYDRLPEHMRDGARLYVEHGIKPGSFMVAVLSNDFIGAWQRADDVNTAAMRAWAMWLHNDVPGGCYGSPEHVKDWIAHRGLAGLTETETP